MKSYDEVLLRMQQAFAQQAGFQAEDASDIGIRLKVLAGEIYSALSQVDFLKRQAFPQTAQEEWLNLHAQQRGIKRKEAVSSTGTLRFTRRTPLSYDAPIPPGTVCSTGGSQGLRFVTSQEGVLPAGSLEVLVPAQAETGGRSSNTAANTVHVWVTPPPGIEGVGNPLPFTGGEDGETDEQLRARITASWNIIPNGTNAAFYRDFALGFDGVRSVSVIPRSEGTGTVTIYAAGAGQAPDSSLLTRIEQELQQVREINVNVTLLPCETVEVNLYAEITPQEGYSIEEVRADCLAALREYFLSLSIGQPVLLAAAGDALFHTPGVKNYSFKTQMCADRFLTQSQLAVPGELGLAEKKEA